MLSNVSNRSHRLRSDSARFAPEESNLSGSGKSSKSKRWQDDTGLSSWASSSRQANERRDLAAQKVASASSKGSVRLENLALTELPPDRNMSSLDRATSLSLSNNNLTQISSSVFALGNLKQLNVSGNQLSELPSELGRLSNLRSLDASHSGVSWVPSEIGNLTKLEKLDLSNNSLSSLPSELGSLSRLKTLNLSGNTLHEQSPGFDYERSSQSSDTQRRGLPSEIKNLKKLQELDLSSNHFQSIPDEIGELSELRSLSFRHNALRDDDSGEAVPDSIASLRRLKKLDVSDNPSLESLPRDFGPLEYKSQKKLQLTRQGSKSSSGPLSFVSKKLGLKSSDQQSGADITISVENTAIPLRMPDAGRLPSLTRAGSSTRLRSKPLYTPPPRRSVSMGDNAPPAAPTEFLTSQHVGAAAPSMLAPAMLPVSAYGGMHPMGSAFGAHSMPAPYPQTAAFGDEQYEHIDPMRYPPEPLVPESPDRASNASSDSFTSTTEEFVPEPPPQTSSRRSKQSRANSLASAASSLQSEPARRRVTIASQAGSQIPRSNSGRPPRPQPAQASAHAFSAFNNSSQQYMPVPATQRMPQQYGYGPAYPDGATMAPYGANMMTSQLGGMQPFGLGATTAVHNSLVEGLKSKIAAGSAPYAEQQLFGSSRNCALAGGSRFSQREPEVTLPSQAVIDRLGIASIQASRLKGMSERSATSLTGDTLKHRVLEARQSRNPGQSLWTLGVSMYRQKFINDLAKSVAESNRDRKRNSQDPADALLVDDPKQISTVYQTLVSKELGLGGFDKWRSKLDKGNEEYSGVFGTVVAPSNYDLLRGQLLDAIAEDEEQSGGASVAKFVESQRFWKDFRGDLERSERVTKHTHGYHD